MNRVAPTGPQVLVREILHGLTEGRFAPGQRLSEPELMTRYGVGRSTVREALGRLAAGGVVVLAPHRGARIRFLSRREARDVLAVTERLLGLAGRQAAEAVAAGADAGPLAEAALAYDTAPPDQEARHRARFYRALIALGGNAELERLLPALQVPLVRAQLRNARAGDAGERARMVAAIRAGDPEGAEAAARAHVARLAATLPGVPDAAFAPEGGGAAISSGARRRGASGR